MDKINCILFSKDRAMQVDATLQSYFVYCLDPENTKITILYTCSNEQHSKQYKQLMQDWKKKPQVTFKEEKDFHKDLLNILNPFSKWNLDNFQYKLLLNTDPRIAKRLQHIVAIPRTDAVVLFLVDDTIFTSEFYLQEISTALLTNPDALGFSLRLGKNISHSYMLRRDEIQPIFNKIDNHFLKFNWTDGDMDFGYPLEVSSSVYRLVDVISSLICVPFTNPNYLEGGMNVNKTKFLSNHPNLLCYPFSKAFCNPINLVQNVSLENRRAEQIQYSTNELAVLFDQGKRINIDPFHHFVPNSCHVEFKLVFNQIKVVHG
jgi:hypothetical protein